MPTKFRIWPGKFTWIAVVLIERLTAPFDQVGLGNRVQEALGDRFFEPVVSIHDLITCVLGGSAALLRLIRISRRDAIQKPLNRHFQRGCAWPLDWKVAVRGSPFHLVCPVLRGTAGLEGFALADAIPPYLGAVLAISAFFDRRHGTL